MNVTCAACGQVVSISKPGEKCPNCGVSIPVAAAPQAVTAAKPSAPTAKPGAIAAKPGAATATPKAAAAKPGAAAAKPKAAAKPGAGSAASTEDLFDRLLLEVKNLGLRARPVPAAATGDFDPGIFPEASEAVLAERPYVRPKFMLVAAVVGIVIVACLAFVYIRSVIRNNTATAALDRVESQQALVKTALEQADNARAAKDYKAALAGYQTVLDLCGPLLAPLHDDTAALPAGPLKDRAEAVASEIMGYQKRAKDGAEAPEVAYGSQGMIQLEDGQWVTPKQKDKMFLDRMKREDRTLVNGEWLTSREIHERKGEVLYQGNWITKEAYAAIIGPASVLPPKPVAPKPSTTFLATEPIWLLDDFAKGTVEWTNVPRDWKADPADLSLDTTGDAPRLLVSMQAGNNEKSAIVRPLQADLRSRTSISMDVTNETGEPLRMAIALGTGKKDEYYEGRWLTVKAGLNKGVQFTLQSSDFKCAPKWTHSARIGNPDQAHWLYILIYNYGKPGKVYLGNVSALGEQ